MSEATRPPELSPELGEIIEERREGLERVVEDDGPFSRTAELLLELADDEGGG